MRKIYAILFLMLVSPFIFSTAFAWDGEPAFDDISRAQIQSNADEMIYLRWSPAVDINIYHAFGLSSTYHAGTEYVGMPYSYAEPPEDITEFLNLVAQTRPPRKLFLHWGNDCSAFVSMCWELDARLTTHDFFNDSQPNGPHRYCTQLGDVGEARTVDLRLGDALVADNFHIVMFVEYADDGIWVMENSWRKAKYAKYAWADLSSYKPIRRNRLLD